MSSTMHRPNNNRSPHQSRRRGFDDDFAFGGGAPSSYPSSSPSSAPARRPPPAPVVATGPELEAIVKWFNPDKGFGFVEMSDGSGDVFLHANTLQTIGEQSVGSGATLQVRVGQGMKGRQVAEVLSVDHSTEQPDGGAGQRRSFGGAPGGARPPRAGGFRREPDMSTAVEVDGIVKWYNVEKGFGFITPETGGKDVFIHASVLERCGLKILTEGQTVHMQVVQGQKGPEAVSIQ
jgi:CspA family cold shock protein